MDYRMLLLFVIIPSLIIAHLNYKKFKQKGSPDALKIGCFSLIISILGMGVTMYFLLFLMFALGGYNR